MDIYTNSDDVAKAIASCVGADTDACRCFEFDSSDFRNLFASDTRRGFLLKSTCLLARHTSDINKLAPILDALLEHFENLTIVGTEYFESHAIDYENIFSALLDNWPAQVKIIRLITGFAHKLMHIQDEYSKIETNPKSPQCFLELTKVYYHSSLS